MTAKTQMPAYFVRTYLGRPTKWKKVSKKKFMEVEEDCGFVSKFPGEPATDGFGYSNGSTQIEGKIEWKRE